MKTYTYNLYGLNETVILRRGRYTQSQALSLRLDSIEGEPIATLTVNPQTMKFTSLDLAVIKTWSEGKGNLEWMIENGICKDTGDRIFLGPYDAVAAIVRVLEEPSHATPGE